MFGYIKKYAFQILTGLGIFAILPAIFMRSLIDPVLIPRFWYLSFLSFSILILWFGKIYKTQINRHSKILIIILLLYIFQQTISSFSAINVNEAIIQTTRTGQWLILFLIFIYAFQSEKINRMTFFMFIQLSSLIVILIADYQII